MISRTLRRQPVSCVSGKWNVLYIGTLGIGGDAYSTMLNLENILSISAKIKNEQTALDDKKIWPHRTSERGKPVRVSAA